MPGRLDKIELGRGRDSPTRGYYEHTPSQKKFHYTVGNKVGRERAKRAAIRHAKIHVTPLAERGKRRRKVAAKKRSAAPKRKVVAKKRTAAPKRKSAGGAARRKLPPGFKFVTMPMPQMARSATRRAAPAAAAAGFKFAPPMAMPTRRNPLLGTSDLLP